MEKLADFVFNIGTEFFRSNENLMWFIIFGLITASIFLLIKKGFSWLAFMGKKKTKLARFDFKGSDWSRSMNIFSLADKHNYRGYGVEFNSSKNKTFVGNISTKSSVFYIEFTKEEADKIVDLITPHLD